jgi:hypothetical protein
MTGELDEITIPTSDDKKIGSWINENQRVDELTAGT